MIYGFYNRENNLNKANLKLAFKQTGVPFRNIHFIDPLSIDWNIREMANHSIAYIYSLNNINDRFFGVLNFLELMKLKESKIITLKPFKKDITNIDLLHAFALFEYPVIQKKQSFLKNTRNIATKHHVGRPSRYSSFAKIKFAKKVYAFSKHHKDKETLRAFGGDMSRSTLFRIKKDARTGKLRIYENILRHRFEHRRY